MPRVFLSPETHHKLAKVRIGFETEDETVGRIVDEYLTYNANHIGEAGGADNVAPDGFGRLREDLITELGRRTGDAEIQLVRNKPQEYSLKRSPYGSGARNLGWLREYSRRRSTMIQVKREFVERAGLIGTLNKHQDSTDPDGLRVEFLDNAVFNKPGINLFIPVSQMDYSQEGFDAVVDVLTKVWRAIK